MKKTVFIAVLMTLTAVLAFSHPPQIKSLTFDPATKVLTVVVVHNITTTQVTDVTKHYVKAVDILVNGVKAVAASFTYQETPEGETLTYKVLAVKGDKVSVTAACSLAGQGAKELVLP
jgi:hypothetical protein